jgi:hypothetical protein
MFALGLASVPFCNSIYDKWTEIPVNLPQVESDNLIYVFPRYEYEMPKGGGGGGSGCDSGSSKCSPNEFGGYSYTDIEPEPNKPR